ncbi:hypothetical protein M0804_002599 [Polistes exclamans]|nr:hypothetical protein M0804_002599 [Polistes exclamans]
MQASAGVHFGKAPPTVVADLLVVVVVMVMVMVVVMVVPLRFCCPEEASGRCRRDDELDTLILKEVKREVEEEKGFRDVSDRMRNPVATVTIQTSLANLPNLRLSPSTLSVIDRTSLSDNLLISPASQY